MNALLTLLLFLGTAQAADLAEAEHVRLSEDIKQLANRQLWTGVEKKYAELEKLGVALSYEDLMHGAYAARALGNTQSAYERLKSAAKLNGTKEVVDWLYAIDANYGQVDLIVHNARGVALECLEMPFDPDQRIAVESAIETVKKDGTFSGLLPKGDYVFAGVPFSVVPGVAIHIEVSPKLKKTEGEIIKTQTPMDGSTATVP